MGNSTKEKILDAALVSFAENGYKGTNLRDLAAGMGLSKSALYKHYTGKEEIWNAVIDRMEAYYTERFGSPEKLPPVPKSCEELVRVTMRMLDFTLHDKKVILTRRLLLTEQFRDERARHFATLHFLTGTEGIFTKFFSGMMASGVLKEDDPELLAFAYTAPITALIHYCDREPEKEPEILCQLEAFVRHFLAQYATKQENAAGDFQYIALTRMPSLKEKAADWFCGKWSVPKAAYLECMEECLSGKVPYDWYLCLSGDEIIAGLGVIENDFHDRKDLTPNVCAVYTEAEYRSRGIAGKLLNMAVTDMKRKGITPIYLLTDHTGFYERYGWEFLCMVQPDGEAELSRMYVHR